MKKKFIPADAEKNHKNTTGAKDQEKICFELPSEEEIKKLFHDPTLCQQGLDKTVSKSPSLSMDSSDTVMSQNFNPSSDNAETLVGESPEDTFVRSPEALSKETKTLSSITMDSVNSPKESKMNIQPEQQKKRPRSPFKVVFYAAASMTVLLFLVGFITASAKHPQSVQTQEAQHIPPPSMEASLLQETFLATPFQAMEHFAIQANVAFTPSLTKEPSPSPEETPAASPTESPLESPEESPIPSPTPAPPAFTGTLQKGDTDQLVAVIQSRLMDLGYMDKDEPTEYYGPMTQGGIEWFQRTNGLSIDGRVGEETFSLLLSNRAKKYSISLDAKGTDVEEFQKRLRELGYLSSATGYFGSETEAAVKKFQERNNLSVDGTVGEKTRELLYSQNAVSNAVSYGEESTVIQSYQERLKKLGYLSTNPDGKYGSDTVAAVKRFQERNGLIADGYIGPQTVELLLSSSAQANAVLFGMSGNDVEVIQQRLQELKYMKSVTGYFGSDTQSAVENFQKRNGLATDGKVGPATMNALLSSNAKAASSSPAKTESPEKTAKPTKTKAPAKTSTPAKTEAPAKTSTPAKTENPTKTTGPTATPQPSATSAPEKAPEISGANASSFISVAQSKLGAPYVRGGKGPSNFDCSGFVYWCLNQIGVKQSYMTSAGWSANTKYQRLDSLSDVKKGDVICFNGHVGIALSGGKMIDASSTQGKIRTTNLSAAYWQREFICAFRIF